MTVDIGLDVRLISLDSSLTDDSMRTAWLRSSKNAKPPFHVRQIAAKKATNKIRTAACQRKTGNLTFF